MGEKLPTVEELRRDLTDLNAELVARMQEWHPSRDQQRILEYFWDRRRKAFREEVPWSVIAFFELDRRHPAASVDVHAKLQMWLSELRARDYLKIRKSNQAYYSLAQAGAVYLIKRHPPLSAYWQSFIETIPPNVRFAYETFTLAGTLAGIIALLISNDFFDFIKSHF